MQPAEPRAIILVDHGSRLPAANQMLEDVAVLVRARQPSPVYAAHMELAEPSIEHAFTSAVYDGARHILVFPYFLSPGRHSQQDIPRLVAQAAEQHPGVGWHVAGPFGLEGLLADVIVSRLSHCVVAGFSCERCPSGSCPSNGLSPAAAAGQ